MLFLGREKEAEAIYHPHSQNGIPPIPLKSIFAKLEDLCLMSWRGWWANWRDARLKVLDGVWCNLTHKRS